MDTPSPAENQVLQNAWKTSQTKKYLPLMKQRQHEFSPPLILGIEGGGTRTVAILADAHGLLVKRVEAGPANLRLLSDPQLTKHLRSLARQFPTPAAVGIGLAGLRNEQDRGRVLGAAESVWPKRPCFACADLETALAAAEIAPESSSHARVLLLSGTGSCCFGRFDGLTAKVGGWGHVLGDKGSAYEVGLRALKAVVYYYDRDGKWPRLGERLLRALHLNCPDELISWVQHAGKQEIAGLAIEVFDAWKEKDAIASDLIEAAAQTLAKDAEACAARLVPRNETVQFILAGSMLLKQPAFARRVGKVLARRWPLSTVAPLKREGAWGAVRLAAGLLQESSLPSGERSGNTLGKNRPGSGTFARASVAAIPEALAASPTECRNPKSFLLDRMPVLDAVRLMLNEEGAVASKLLKHEEKIARAIERIARSFKKGGRLFYVGAGTSGRLGTLDASECPPTFRAPPGQVQGIMAGGQEALWQSKEGAEDDALAGIDAITFRGVTPRDVVVGIAASGRTPFVWGALHEARRRKAYTILVCFNPNIRIAPSDEPDLAIAVDLGPEILTGSTRLKAGTATKLILNAFTTLAMVRVGKVVSNLMVDLNPSNEKLRDRAVRIVRELTLAHEHEALQALQRSEWVVQDALQLLRKKRKRLTSSTQSKI